MDDFQRVRIGLALLLAAVVIATNEPAQSGNPLFMMLGVFAGGYLMSCLCGSFVEGGLRALFSRSEDALGRFLGASFTMIGLGLSVLFTYLSVTQQRPDVIVAMFAGAILYMTLLRGPMLRLTHDGG